MPVPKPVSTLPSYLTPALNRGLGAVAIHEGPDTPARVIETLTDTMAREVTPARKARIPLKQKPIIPTRIFDTFHERTPCDAGWGYHPSALQQTSNSVWPTKQGFFSREFLPALEEEIRPEHIKGEQFQTTASETEILNQWKTNKQATPNGALVHWIGMTNEQGNVLVQRILIRNNTVLPEHTSVLCDIVAPADISRLTDQVLEMAARIFGDIANTQISHPNSALGFANIVYTPKKKGAPPDALSVQNEQLAAGLQAGLQRLANNLPGFGGITIPSPTPVPTLDAIDCNSLQQLLSGATQFIRITDPNNGDVAMLVATLKNGGNHIVIGLREGAPEPLMAGALGVIREQFPEAFGKPS